MSPSLQKILGEAAALRRDGNHQQALALLNAARQRENAPALFLAMAEIFSSLGIPAGAEQVLQEGVKHHREDTALAVALANSYYRADRSAEGLAVIEPFAAAASALPTILLTYAALLNATGEREKARELLERMIAHHPENAAALANLAGMHIDTRDYEKAEALLTRAKAADHASSHIALQLAQVYFRTGRLAEAWRAYEARFGTSAGDPNALVKRRAYPQPLWQGEPLAATETLLVHGDEGVGEEIMHASVLPDAQARAPNLCVECDARLVPLFARSLEGMRVIAKGAALLDEASIARQLPIGQLPALFRRDFHSFPRHTGYMKADVQKTARLRAAYLGRAAGRKIIGISWKSKKLRQGDPKSTTLENWQPLFENKNAFFVSLQHQDDDNAQAYYTDAEIDQAASLDDFAAQTAAMDAVVSVSNTTAHMAGALGIKAAILLPASRGLMNHWFDTRDDSPWYPSLTLLRQTKDGVWDDVMQRAAAFVEAL